MTEVIKIGDKEVGMTATASCTKVFKNIFKYDFLSTANRDNGDMSTYQDMAFVMAMMHSHGPFAAYQKTLQDYFDWCDQFAPMDMASALPDVVSLWAKSAESTSIPKEESH